MLQLRLETRQTQKIVITPQLRQAIKLLQLSAIELQSYIENEVRENPLLSVEERPDNEGAPEALPEIVASANGEADIPPGDRLYEGEPATASAAAEWSSASGSSLSSGEDFDPFATIASTKSLADHLNEQAQLAFTSAHDRLIARYLADLVDIDGYVRSPLEDVAASLSTSLEEIERVLATLQTFDPPGICARDLAECMALQLKEKNRYDPFMERLLSNLDLIAACDFQRLKKVCGVDAEDLREMISELRLLNPRPGRSFDRVEIETLVPDVIVRRGPDGEWRAELNPGAAPSIAPIMQA